MSNTSVFVWDIKERVETINRQESGSPSKVRKVEAGNLKVGNSIVTTKPCRRHFTVLKVNLSKCKKQITVTARSLPAFRRNRSMLAFVYEARKHIQENLNESYYSVYESAKSEGMLMYQCNHLNLKATRYEVNDYRHRHCACCGSEISPQSNAIEIILRGKPIRPLRGNTITQVKDFKAFVHLDTCESNDARWRVNSFVHGIKQVSLEEISGLSEDLDRNMAHALMSGEYWVLYSQTTKRYEFARSVEEMNRVVDDFLETGDVPSHFSRVATSSLNGKTVMCFEQLEAMLTDEELQQYYFNIEGKKESGYAYVAVAFTLKGLQVYAYQTLEEALNKFKAMKYYDGLIPIGTVKL